MLGTTGAGVMMSCSGPAAATTGCTGTAEGAGRGSTAWTCCSLRACDLHVAASSEHAQAVSMRSSTIPDLCLHGAAVVRASPGTIQPLKVTLFNTYVGSACASTANSAATAKTRQRAIFRKALRSMLYNGLKHSIIDALLCGISSHCIRPDHTPRPNCRDCKITMCPPCGNCRSPRSHIILCSPSCP